MYVHVVVQAGAKHEHVEKLSETRFKISVKEVAKQNQANLRIRTIIAEQYGVPLATVRIINGHQHSSKLLSIH